MEQNSMDKLQELMDKKEKREKDVGGEIFAFWGMLMILNILVQLKFKGMPWIGLIFMIFGVVTQVVYIRILIRKAGFQLAWNKILSALWLYIAVLLLIIQGVFSYAAKIIDPKASYALTLLVLAAGMVLSGIFVKKWSYRFGGAAFLIVSICITLPVFQNAVYYFMMAGLFFGLVLPGIFCKIEEKLT